MSIDMAKPVGKLFEELPRLWEEANLTERGRLFAAMLDVGFGGTIHK